MMKLIYKLFLAALVLSVYAGFNDAKAEEPAASSVVVVRIEEVFRNSDYAKQMETQIRASFRQEEKEIEDLQKVIRTQQEKLQNDAFLAPDTYQYKKKVLELQILQLQLQDKAERFEKLSRTKMANYWRGVYADFQKAIKHLVKIRNYDIVITAPDVALSEKLEKSNAPEAIISEILRRQVQYVSPENDMTDEVIKIMNAINAKRSKN